MPDALSGKLVMVIDDDPLILEAMDGLLRSWGCRVVTAGSESALLAGLVQHDQIPDLIISDYNLPGGKTGADVIRRLRGKFGAPIPAFLVSGETNYERLREASSKGFHVLRKPVSPATLEAMVNLMLRGGEDAREPR